MSYSKITEKVISFIGGKRADAIQTCRDAAKHGADSGYPCFTYCSDTCRFFKANKDLIFSNIMDLSNEFGTSPDEMLKHWRGLASLPVENRFSSYAAGTMSKDDKIIFENGMAWFALEEAGHELESELESERN